MFTNRLIINKLVLTLYHKMLNIVNNLMRQKLELRLDIFDFFE